MIAFSFLNNGNTGSGFRFFMGHSLSIGWQGLPPSAVPATLPLMPTITYADDEVPVLLPRAVYESIAERVAHEGHPDVPTFLAAVATTKTIIIDREPPPDDEN
jgi:hypothetical protein